MALASFADEFPTEYIPGIRRIGEVNARATLENYLARLRIHPKSFFGELHGAYLSDYLIGTHEPATAIILRKVAIEKGIVPKEPFLPTNHSARRAFAHPLHPEDRIVYIGDQVNCRQITRSKYYLSPVDIVMIDNGDAPSKKRRRRWK